MPRPRGGGGRGGGGFGRRAGGGLTIDELIRHLYFAALNVVIPYVTLTFK